VAHGHYECLCIFRSTRPPNSMQDMPPIEKISYSQFADLPGVEILSVSNSQRLWRVYNQAYG